MLIDKQRYKSSLIDLWHNVFGDDYSYIELIFNEECNDSILCFGKTEKDKVVSAFYLLKNSLSFNGEEYKGFYLYAAATLYEYRSKGIMAELIKEAQLYCKAEGYDYITLLPAEESLYSYYERFGFEEAMYRYCSEYKSVNKVKAENTAIDSLSDMLSVRSKYKGNMLTFDKGAFSYAVSCLAYSGYRFYRLSDDSYVLYSEKDKSVEEFISPLKGIDINSRLLWEFLPEGSFTIKAPYELDFCDSFTVERAGMLYPVNGKLCRNLKYTDIYMNIALD